VRALWTLTLANIRSYTRDRAALFWTLAFPLIFIVMFGLIFQGGEAALNLAWVDNDGSPQSAELRTSLAAASGVSVEDFPEQDALDRIRRGEVDAVIVVPEGYGGQLAANAGSDTPGAAFVPALDTRKVARVFQKGTDPAIDSYSGFFDNGHRKATGLGDYLKAMGVTDVHVCGLATDYCVKFTALDARQLGFRTFLIEDASRGVNVRPGDVQRAVEEMKAAGVTVVTSKELLDRETKAEW
jgi:nicotinamidase-related amidase